MVQNKDYGRMMKNILDHGREIPEMILLCKDHKKWDGKAPLPTRPVISGNKGINTHLSELLSEILEPVSGSIGGGEIASTEEALNRINQINDLILKHEDVGAIDVLTDLSKQLIPPSHGKPVINDFRQDELTGLDTDDSFKFAHVSGSLNESTCSLDSLDLETIALLEDLKQNNAQGTERGKITSFFPKVEKKNLCFSDNYKEKSHRQLGERKTDFDLSVKHNCLAGKVWNDRRKEELGRPGGITNNKEPEPQVTQIQDESENFIFFGADVSALYPSLDQIETAALVADSIQSADIEYVGMDFDRMCIYLYLTMGENGMRELGLGDYIPVKIDDGKNKSFSLNTKFNRDLVNWRFSLQYTKETQRKLVAAMVHVASIVLMQTSCYSFGGFLYLQTSGSGIGLRASACIAKIAMAIWDKTWALSQSLWGIKVHLYMRYIDDLRLYLKPIGEGWWWIDRKWVYDPSKQDSRDPETRTKEELQKSFDDVFNFLRFTTEGERDFKSGYLPTLDFQTKVLDCGVITYKHFDKEMASNLCIQKGTALATSTVFSSLRQDLCRRLLNTSTMEEEETFVQVVESYIQRLVNSGHTFSFTKAVVLQAITRYKYMLERDSRLPEDPKYQPLYRSKLFDREERMIRKRIDFCTWYSGEDIGDPFRHGWKNHIRRRGDNVKNNRKRLPASNREITTTLFVPATAGSILFDKIREKEEVIGREFDWGIKILEKSGSPLTASLMTKFPSKVGCPFGAECNACENDGVACTPRNVVYKSTCSKCSTESSTGDIMETGMKDFTYIGETGRNFRCRVREHMSNLKNLSKNSFQVLHWMNKHALDTEPPYFKFKIISQHKDALSRQLNEALWIINQGGLNKRCEFNINELCRLESRVPNKEHEKALVRIKQERKQEEENIKHFIDVMNYVKNLHCTDPNPSNVSPTCRKRSTLSSTLVGGKRRKINMDFSTPRASKTGDKLIDEGEESPIPWPATLVTGKVCDQEGEVDSEGDEVGTEKLKTNVSDGVDIIELTPRGVLTVSTEERSLFNMTSRVEGILKRKSILRRFNSDPELVVDVTQNVFGGPNLRRRSLSLPKVGDLTLANMSSDPSFEGCEKEQDTRGIVTPTHSRGEEILIISPEVEALDLQGVTKTLKFSKRRLSPGVSTPIARISKQLVREENSPLLRERENDWLNHEYEFYKKDDRCGIGMDGGMDEQTNILSSPRRSKLVARRRLNTLASVDLQKESMSTWGRRSIITRPYGDMSTYVEIPTTSKILPMKEVDIAGKDVKEVDIAGKQVLSVKERKNVVGNLIMKEEDNHERTNNKKKKKKGDSSGRGVVIRRRSKLLKGQQQISKFLSPKTARGGKHKSQRDRDGKSSSEDDQ